jgi:hypothetical protein
MQNWLSANKESVMSEESKRWSIIDNVIYVSVTLAKSTDGEGLIKRLEENGNHVGDYAKSMLRSEDFKPSAPGTYKVVILAGLFFENDDRRITEDILDKVVEIGFVRPNPDIGCLLRELFTDSDINKMGLRWIVTMHEPIIAHDGEPSFLGIDCYEDGRWLCAFDGSPYHKWSRDGGFAFLVPQVS